MDGTLLFGDLVDNPGRFLRRTMASGMGWAMVGEGWEKEVGNFYNESASLMRGTRSRVVGSVVG